MEMPASNNRNISSTCILNPLGNNDDLFKYNKYRANKVTNPGTHEEQFLFHRVVVTRGKNDYSMCVPRINTGFL